MEIAAFFQPLTGLDPAVLAAAAAMVFAAGFVKGAVGFGAPMIIIGGLGSLMQAQDAVAASILPGLVSNVWQTCRQGLGPARETLARFWKLTLLLALIIGLSAQLVPHIPSRGLFTVLGTVVAVAAALQLAGWRPRAPADSRRQRWLEIAVGVLAGIIGGLTGVWGPPILFFLIALDVPKQQQVRAQGLTFLVGAVILVFAHLESGVLNGLTLPLSVAMCLPLLAGMALGLRAQDRMDQQRFRRIALLVLCVAGLNLLRRGLL